MEVKIYSYIEPEEVSLLFSKAVECIGKKWPVEPVSSLAITAHRDDVSHIIFYYLPNTSDKYLQELKQKPKHIPLVILTDDTKNLLDIKHKGYKDIIPVKGLSPEVLSVYIECCVRRFIAETSLNLNDYRHKLVTKAINNIIWDWQLNKKSAVWLGTGLQTILGYSQDEILVNNNFWEEQIHPEDRERVTQKLNKIIDEGKETSWQDEYRFLTRGGEYRCIRDKGIMLYEGNKLTRMVGSMEDITDIVNAQEATLKSEINYKMLFNFIPLASFIWDINDYQILEVNEMAMKEYGYTREEFLNMTVLQLRPDNFIKEFKSIVDGLNRNNILKHEQVWVHINKQKQEMLMQVSSYKILFQGNYVMLALAQNITDKMILQAQLEQENSLKQQQIAEAVVITQEKERTRIARELHDNVNQLLGASRLYIEAAKKEAVNADELLSQASGYIMNAIEEIRVLSRTLNTPLIKEMGLKETVENLCSDLSLVNEAILELKLDKFDEDGYDENLKITIYRIIQEQLTNIFKYAEATHIFIEIENSITGISLLITDDGIGFNTRLHTNGIGIKNIYSRSALYKGDVTIESAPGKGCRLSIFFPEPARYAEPAKL